MPLKTQPEDYPAAFCFHVAENDSSLRVTVSLVAADTPGPYRIEGGEPRFTSGDEFKARAVEVGLSPAVAEDPRRSFNATARQLRGLGFSVQLLNADSR